MSDATAAPDTIPEFLTVDEVARVLRLSDDSVLRRIADGALPAIRVGEGPAGSLRIPREALRAFLESRRVRPGPRIPPSLALHARPSLRS